MQLLAAAPIHPIRRDPRAVVSPCHFLERCVGGAGSLQLAASLPRSPLIALSAWWMPHMLRRCIASRRNVADTVPCYDRAGFNYVVG